MICETCNKVKDPVGHSTGLSVYCHCDIPSTPEPPINRAEEEVKKALAVEEKKLAKLTFQYEEATKNVEALRMTLKVIQRGFV